MVDIYNSCNNEIEGLKIKCNEEYEEDKYILNIPDIGSHKRIIVVFSTAIPGTYDTGIKLSYGNLNKEIAGLEKGYTGVSSSIQLSNNNIKKTYNSLPWIPNWDKIYYYDNIGRLVLTESREENRKRIGYSADKTTRINLIAKETLKKEKNKMLLKDFSD